MTADYTLYYWPIPFRGQLVRAVLAQVGASWDEADTDTLHTLWQADTADQPAPFMGVPVLTDHRANLSLSQLPAILTYLGRQHGLLPTDALGEALTAKVIADASDVLYEMTRYHGALMWTTQAWEDYAPRLVRWMEIFAETGRRHGLGLADGYMLGTDRPGIADLTVSTLWGTMVARFPALRPALVSNAPAIASLSDRIGALAPQAALRERTDREFGDAWCGGEIEASLRRVLGPSA